MVSKKMVALVREFAIEKGYDVKLTELAIMSLFKEIRRHQMEMKYEFIKVNGLGSFFLKPWAVARNITLRKRWIAKGNGINKEFNEALVEKLEKIYAQHHKRFLTDIKEGITKKGKKFIDYYKMFDEQEGIGDNNNMTQNETDREDTESLGEPETNS